MAISLSARRASTLVMPAIFNTNMGTAAEQGAEAARSPADGSELRPGNGPGHGLGLGARDSRWRSVVLNFTPSWFSVTMGTGMVSLLLHQLPYNAAWIRYIAVLFFILDIFLFTIFSAISAARYALYPELWGTMLRHPSQSLFIGTFPMGFAMIISMMVLVCRGWGDWLVYWAWAFWWLDVAMSMITCITLPFIVMHHHKPGLSNITASILLPIVPTVVCAATGGIVADALSNPKHAAVTLTTSYILWGVGEALSLTALALYFHRLTVHSLPPKEAIVSVFLPIGPLCQGAFGIQQLGRVALKVLPQTAAFGVVDTRPGSLHGGDVFYYIGIFIGLALWGFGMVWLLFALISIATMKRFPFNMGWWGLTFPLGTMASCTRMLGENLSSPPLKILSMILSLIVCMLWLLVACRTASKAYSGEIFFAPCLQDLRGKAEQSGSYRTA